MSTSKKQKRPRTYARNRIFSRKGKEIKTESDTWYFTKLVIVFLLAAVWLKFNQPLMTSVGSISALPVGFFGGIIAIHLLEKYQFNRKILYAVLLIATLISYYLPTAIVI